jgi:integrase/recombinase XerD
MESVILRRIHHRESDCLAMFFKSGNALSSAVRRIQGVKFSITHKCWYVLDSPHALDNVKAALSGLADIDFAGNDVIPSDNRQANQSKEALKALATPSQLPLLKQMEAKLKLRGYSDSTINTYVSQFKLFLEHLGNRDVTEVNEKDIRNYLLYMIEKRGLSRSTLNQAINSIKFYFEKMLGQSRKTYYLERPMKEHRLPRIMSEEEIGKLFDAADNLKHKLMLMIIYSAGLRRSELLKLRLGDIDRERNSIFIRGGKGCKDRTTILAKRLVGLIDRYLAEYRPSYWLFEGVNRSKYSASSLHQVFMRALHKAEIHKKASLHTLRHSFATHLLESGASTLYIQKLLGHESPKTTEIYAQVTKFGLDKIRSPFDQDIFGKTEGE